MCKFKMTEVVMLPTNEKANSLIQFGQSLRLNLGNLSEMVIKRHHLYFLSDEEIKEGDWFIG